MKKLCHSAPSPPLFKERSRCDRRSGGSCETPVSISSTRCQLQRLTKYSFYHVSQPTHRITDANVGWVRGHSIRRFQHSPVWLRQKCLVTAFASPFNVFQLFETVFCVRHASSRSERSCHARSYPRQSVIEVNLLLRREHPVLSLCVTVCVSHSTSPCVVIVILISMRLSGVCVSHQFASENFPFWHDGKWYR